VSVRVYLPSTLARLAAGLEAGSITTPARTAFAVTQELASTSGTGGAGAPEGDDREELEYLAMLDAARASLRMLAGRPGPMLRVVVAADVPTVVERPDLDRAAVTLQSDVPWRSVASVLIDGADAAPAVEAAASRIDEADLGDLDAEFVVGAAEDFELAWYAPSEVRYLIE
jgi:hypothetical protein